ncbi:MAG TPA: hypothetical protein DET40_24295 [Lentisphaeria bacterium]|nr:MAG: hypothetical protein A2X45_00055 [Lentisphaerae bacterium GWF2_50_93]HCE46680.1 hypothetical protein [Lentisphaeria bacterium]
MEKGLVRILAMAFVMIAMSVPSYGQKAVPVEFKGVDISPAYPCNPEKDFNKEFAPEIKEQAKDVQWKKNAKLSCFGRIDFQRELGKVENVVAYARIVLKSAKAGKMHLDIGSDDGMTLFVNGVKVVSSKNVMRGLKPGEDQVDVNLVQGNNVLLFKVFQGNWAYELQFSATAEPGMDLVQVGDFPPVKAVFQFELPKEGCTSAGIYNSSGMLVRSLWAMKPMEKGKFKGSWDGEDEFGNKMPAGEYEFHVVLNNSTYKNVGVIGNTGKPTNTFGHVPANFECLAVDKEGFLYSVHDWDEPHHDVIRWNPETGHVYSHSSHPVNGIPKAVCVDDEYAYVTAWGDGDPNNPQDREKSLKFDITKLRIKKGNGDVNWDKVPFTKAGNEIVVYKGGASYPEVVSSEDRGIMTVALLSIAVKDNSLYVTDSLAGKVRIYDKLTGDAKGTFDVKLPQSIAFAPDGRIWIGHERSKISIFSPDGKYLSTPVSDLKKLNSIAFGPDSTLYVTDQSAGQVRIYKVNGDKVSLRRTFGEKAKSGDRAADRFHDLHGLAVDAEGNIFTAQNERGMCGGRIAKYAASGKLEWEQMGLEFSSSATYAKDNPDILFSYYRHNYKVNKKDGSWEYIGNNLPDPAPYWTPGGYARIVNIGGNDFYFGAIGDGVQVYRIEKNADKNLGPVMKLVSIMGRSNPLPDGKNGECWRPENFFLWSWNDDKGDNAPQPEEISYTSKPEDKKPLWQYGALTIDPDMNVWMASFDRGGDTPEKESVWMIPMSGVDKLGNPVYDWSKAAIKITRNELLIPGMPVIPEKPLSVQPKLVQKSADGLTYIYGFSNWNRAPQNGGLHMGGNILECFKGSEARWRIVLPEMCVGLSAIPEGNGGCMIGGQPFIGTIHHYSKDGQLIGIFGPDKNLMGSAPNHTTGLMDMYSALNICRDPRDGILDVFVEENYNLRIPWYRVDDRDIQTISGKLTMK